MSETKKEWKLPKNTRQVGDGSGDKKLYVEDYVVTYLNRLSGQKETAKALLLGTVKEQNLYPYVFVDAAIEIEDFRMSEEEKIQLDKQIETEFGIKKVVGWFLSSKEKPVIYNQEILDIYKQLFQEENQVLLVADSLEDELTAFFMEEEILTEQPGYFIYYEKNVPMQKRLIQTSTDREDGRKCGGSCNSTFSETCEAKEDGKRGRRRTETRLDDLHSRRISGYDRVGAWRDDRL